MYNYVFQPPYHYTPYVGRTVYALQTNELFVDYERIRSCVPGGEIHSWIPPILLAVWSSIYLQCKTCWATPEEMLLSLHDNADLIYLIDIVSALNNTDIGMEFSLFKCRKWEDVLLALANGLSVICGGSVYSSFSKSLRGGIVPMPDTRESLLGSYVFNLVRFEQKPDTGVVIGNLGKSFGDNGMLRVRGSYLRNLDIMRDFFVITAKQGVYARA